MKMSDSVIEGDEQCRDGHYRVKLDLRSQTATGFVGHNLPMNASAANASAPCSRFRPWARLCP
jgi:hypothetical protein